MDFDPRGLFVGRPDIDEVPWRLLCLDRSETDVERLTELVRIARNGDAVLGGYLLERPRNDSLTWNILRLAVLPAARRRGLGYWLLGHAVGVAEARGGAEIAVDIDQTNPARSLFTRYGFEPVQSNRMSFFTYSE